MTHDELVERSVRWLRGTMRCGVVLSEVSGSGHEQPDAIGWKHGGLLSILVEVKVTRQDFFADQKKWHRKAGRGVGQERYYFVPGLLVDPGELPDGWGLACLDSRNRVRVMRRVKCERYDPEVWRRELPLLYSALRKVELGLPIDRLHAQPSVVLP